MVNEDKLKKVKILKSRFHEDKDVVEWKVSFIDEDRNDLTLVWPSSDLGSAIGIDAYIPPEAMKKFCEDIEGKTINLAIEADIEEFPSFEESDNTTLDNLHKTMDHYPFNEAIDIEENSE